MKRLLIVTNVDWFLISHRLVVASHALKNGWEVFVACEDTGRSGEITSQGIHFENLVFSRSGTNLIAEIRSYLKFKNLYRRVKPDVVHHITIKPVIYGTLAARSLGIKGIVNAVSGMGYLFVDGKFGLFQRAVMWLMRKGSNHNSVSYIFQNQDDKEVLRKFGVLERVKSVNLIKGSGVSLDEFKYQLPIKKPKLRILFAGRMLWDKGIRELRIAADILKNDLGKKIEIRMIGKVDLGNKSAVPLEYLNEWVDGEYVQWKGHIDDVYSEYVNADVVILPSYREGLPKNLIEACAVGRPIITTDAVGCKDCVDDGINGIIVPVKDAEQLALAIRNIITTPEKLLNMGMSSRRKAEKDFNVDDVVIKHLEIYNQFIF
ncbi:glycosyltransferase family 4 protein [Sphingobacterium humi]|uniref:Glycosyltransferase n=1 Tax=Sphingobacterium humi TaxID=1796905 RepID=A0A6N8L3P5_9SPHI|nr:glycosyltransferase family 4 protein [Sphingobacterium humi]MVZ63649.1 glycosyltransferase [Sphingobacterium humi]